MNLKITPQTINQLKRSNIKSMEQLSVIVSLTRPQFFSDIIDMTGVSRRSLEHWVHDLEHLIFVENVDPVDNSHGTGRPLSKLMSLTDEGRKIIDRLMV